MLSGVEACSRKGFTITNVDTLICSHVTITGQEGEAFELLGINHFEER